MRRIDLDVVLSGTRPRQKGLPARGKSGGPSHLLGFTGYSRVRCGARADLFKVLPLTSSFEPGPDGMEEKRKYPRTEVEEPAYVSSGGSVMRCVVRNISREGAAIDVEKSCLRSATLSPGHGEGFLDRPRMPRSLDPEKPAGPDFRRAGTVSAHSQGARLFTRSSALHRAPLYPTSPSRA